MTLSQLFDGIIRKMELEGACVPEYRFHPTRRWRFDRAFPRWELAIEFEGGVWIKGRHTRGQGFVNDCTKYNEATAMGWRVFRFATEEQVADFPRLFKQLVGTPKRRME